MKKKPLYFLLIFLSSNGVAGDFNQQIEEFDNYISNSHILKWGANSLRSDKGQSEQSEQSEEKGKTYVWNSLLTDKERTKFFYKILNKGQDVLNIDKKNVTFKIELVNYDASGNVSAIKVKNKSDFFNIPFNELPSEYKKLITITGSGGNVIVYKNSTPPKSKGRVKCYSIEVLSVL